MMNYGAMLVAGRGGHGTDSHVSDLKEARDVYQRAMQVGRRMQSRPSMPLQKTQSQNNTPAVAAHMVAQAEAALQAIEARLARDANDAEGPAAARAAAQRLCTIM